MTLLSDGTVDRIVAQNEHAYLAVATRRGPHVTPQRVTSSGGRLWFTTSRQARRVEALRRRSAAGVVVSSSTGSAMLGGRVSILDPFDPIGWAEAPEDFVRSGRASVRLLRAHVRDLIGYVRGFGDLPMSWLPPNRVLLSFLPDRLVLLSHTGAVIARRGAWDLSDGPPAPDDRERANGAIPVGVVGQLRDVRFGALALNAPDGPIVARAEWLPDRGVLRFPAAAASIVGRSNAPAAFVFSESAGSRPVDKSGSLLRGSARLTWVDGRFAECELNVDTVTRWSGFESQTESRTGAGGRSSA